MAHLTTTHKIRDELKPFAIPNIQVRTRRRFTIQLHQGKRLVVCNLRFRLNDSGGPQHAHRVDRSSLPQSKSNIGRSGSRKRGICFEFLRETSGPHFDLRTNATAITYLAFKIYAQRAVRVAAVVASDFQSTKGRGERSKYDIRVAVAVDITRRQQDTRPVDSFCRF